MKKLILNLIAVVTLTSSVSFAQEQVEYRFADEFQGVGESKDYSNCTEMKTHGIDLGYNGDRIYDKCVDLKIKKCKADWNSDVEIANANISPGDGGLLVKELETADKQYNNCLQQAKL